MPRELCVFDFGEAQPVLRAKTGIIQDFGNWYRRARQSCSCALRRILSYEPFFLLLLLLLCALPLLGQSSGEMRLRVTDPDGRGVKSSVEILSEANQFQKMFVTDEAGDLAAKRLPFGVYEVQVRREGFAWFAGSFEIRSAVPAEYHVTLSIAPMSTSVTVNPADTLIDPHRTGTVNRIASDVIESRTTSLPGRSLQDLVNSQPGWLYEGNAVLHPRGSEYQTQFVVDGIPLIDNRTPSFGPEIEADDNQSTPLAFRPNMGEKWVASWKSTRLAIRERTCTDNSFSPVAASKPPKLLARCNMGGKETLWVSAPTAIGRTAI